MVKKPIKNLLFCLVIMLACVETIFSMQDQRNMYNAIIEQLINDVKSKEIQIHQLSEDIRNVFDSFINKADLSEKSISTPYKELQKQLRSTAKPITSAAQMYTAEEIKKFSKSEAEEKLIQLIHSLQRKDFIFRCEAKRTYSYGLDWCTDASEEVKEQEKKSKRNWIVKDEIQDLFDAFDNSKIQNYNNIMNTLLIKKINEILIDIPN